MANPFRAAAREVVRSDEQKEVQTGTVVTHWRPQSPSFEKWDTERAIKEGFKSSVWVYAAVDRIMKSVASVPFVTNTQVDEGDMAVVEDAALTALLEKPNPLMDRNRFMRSITAHFMLGGNIILQKVRGRVVMPDGSRSRVVTELWPVPPNRVTPEVSKMGRQVDYKITPPKGGKPIPVKGEDVVHIMLVDPENPYWGMSPLQAAARVVDTDVEAVKWNMTAIQNRSVPDGIFTYDKPLPKPQWEEARQMVREEYEGRNNSRRPWVLGAGAKWQQMSITPAEMDFIESRKLSREEILAVFQVPPPLVGLYDNATLANIDTARKILWVDTVIPLLDVFVGALMQSLGAEFGVDGTESWLAYDTTNVDAFQEELGDRVDAAEGLFKMGVPMMQINSLLELGLKPYPGWETSYIPSNMMPALDAGLGGDDMEPIGAIGAGDDDSGSDADRTGEVEESGEEEDADDA